MTDTNADPSKLEGHPLGSPSIPNPSTQTFNITISTKEDYSHDARDKLLKWIKSSTIHSYVVTERGVTDREHLHAVLVFKEHREARKIQENVYQRFVKPFHPTSIGKFAVQVHVLYSHAWYDTYLQKETGREILWDTYDREKIEHYFPAQATQEFLQTTGRKRKGTEAATYITDHVSGWESSEFENTPEGSLCYLKHRMFNLRDLVPLADKRKLVEKAYMYFEYRNGIVTPCAEETRLLKRFDETFEPHGTPDFRPPP